MPWSRLIPLLICLPLVTGESATDPWTLEKAVAQALKAHPQMAMAEAALAHAAADARLQSEAFLPQFLVDATYARTDLPGNAFGMILNQRAFTTGIDFNDPGHTDDLGLRAGLRWNLYAGGQDQAKQDAATHWFLSALKTREDRTLAIAFQTAAAWLEAYKARDGVAAAEAAVAAYDAHLSSVKKRQATGNVLETDVLEMEVRLATVQEGLLQAKNGKALTCALLGRMLGIPCAGLELHRDLPVLAVPMDAATTHPAVQAAESQTQAAGAGVRVAQAAWSPRLSTFASLEHHRGFESDGNGVGYMGGLSLEWDFSFERRLAATDAARARLKAARAVTQDVRQTISLARRQAEIQLSNADERIAVARKAETQAVRVVELMSSRYQQGLALNVQMIDAQTAATAARQRRVAAEADRVLAIAALRQACGLAIVAAE